MRNEMKRESTMRGHSDGKNRRAMGLPGKTFLERRRRRRKRGIHPPGSNLAILVATPNEAIAVVNEQGHDRRGGGGFMERGGVFIASRRPASHPASRLVPFLEVPHAHASLLPGPQLPLRARNVPQELPHLRLPQRVRSQLQARRPTGMHCRAARHLEDSTASAAADELRQTLALAGILIGRPAVHAQPLLVVLAGGRGRVGGVGKEIIVFVVGRGIVAVIAVVAAAVSGINLGVVQAVLADLVVAFVGGGPAELLGVREGFAGSRGRGA